ncbi:3-hydroxy-9,10-secoandrosta-1,3,5(10)-triene-9,17-dione monooxygenase reductase subunit [Nocardia amamiensis]|uniref:3-hydroxy-9,10-secoandrosta-1,3,5(10)-triene-9, 17-dione monooxygenase reductase subunit n=1 Tax=Nocardia amamiensis TaxID=404578 RepID=UPI000834B0F1|nr:3-hydroxy-9,10-secoandrosta-1,3,5(10)-triene-9,17-dione monooxygenase reductase subunit [Nocardia amamiensis]
MTTTSEYPKIDSRRFRNVLGQFCTGITVITTFRPGSDENPAVPVGFACQSFAALSLDPPFVLFCPTKGSRALSAIEQSGRFCVNVLTEQQQRVCDRFGSREPDKFAGIEWSTSALGLPVLKDVLATIQCTVDSVLDGGDHHIVVGRVLALSEQTNSGGPLLFYRGRYTAIEPGKSGAAPWRMDLERFLTTTPLDSW